MNPAKSAAKPAAPGVPLSSTTVNQAAGRIVHNGKSYRVILHYDAGTKELNTEDQLKRIKKIIDLSQIGANEKLSNITIEDGKVFRTQGSEKKPVDKKLQQDTLDKIKKTFDKVVREAGIAAPQPQPAKPAAPAPKAAAKPAAQDPKPAAKPAAAKPKAPAKIELETDDESESVDGQEASQRSEQEEEVESDGASTAEDSDTDEQDFSQIDAAAKAAAKPAANAAAKPKAPAAKPAANPPANPKVAAKAAAKPAADSESEVDESERSEVSEAAESDEDEVKNGEGTTVEFVPADLLNADEIPREVMELVVASTKVPANEIKGYIPNHDHNMIFRAFGISYLVALYHQNTFKEFEDNAGAEISKLPQSQQDKILQEYGEFVTALNDLRTNSLVEFLEFLESEHNDKLLCRLLRSLAREQVDEADQSDFTNVDAAKLREIFKFGIILFPPQGQIGAVDFDKSLWIYKNENDEFVILVRIHHDEDESLI